MFDKRGRAANVSNTKNAPLWARLWYSTQREGQGTCRTPKTCPQGHVRGVRHEGKGRKCAEHYEHAHKGMFIVFGARGTAENVSNIKNMPLRACSWCPTREEWRERAEHDEHAHKGMFVVFDARGRERTRRTSEHVLGGRVLVFETSQRGGGRVVHHKQTHKGLFVVFETRGRGRDVPSTKTRHSGRVLMFEMSERGEGRVVHHEHAHKGVFVVFETRGRRRTPKHAILGVFWCSRRGEGEWERVVHHKHALVGVFGVFETRGKKGNAPNIKNTPHGACFRCSARLGCSVPLCWGCTGHGRGREVVSRVGERGRGANGAFSTCSAAVLSGS